MIDTQAIRKKILDLALRGKLTEQLPEDGTAEEAFLQIQAEQIGESRKNKCLLPMSEDEVPFEIPNNWQWVRLGCVLDVISGVSYDKSDVTSNGLRIIRGGNIQASKIVLDESDVFLPEKYFDEQKIVRKDDIIIVASTGSSTAIGRAGFSVNDIPDTMIGAFLRICRPKSFVYAHYLHILFMSDYYNRHIRELSKGTNINNVKESYITSFAIPFPPGAEQHRISEKVKSTFSILDTIDALQSQYQDNLATLKSKIIDAGIQGKLTEQLPEDGNAEELYQQIQQEKLALEKAGKTKKSKPLPPISDEEKPFDIPESWKWVRFSDLMLTVSTGPFGSMLHKSDYLNNGIPLVNPMNIVDGKIIPSDKMMVSEESRLRLASYVLHEGMIVMGRRGEMGRCAIVNKNEDGWLCGTGSFFMEPSNCIHVQYVIVFLSTIYAKTYLGGQSIGMTMSNLNHTILTKMPVPLPPLAQQKRIVAKLEELLPLCEG